MISRILELSRRKKADKAAQDLLRVLLVHLDQVK